MKTKLRALIFGLALLLFGITSAATGANAKNLDEILNYDITISVNEDATLDMHYHIDWKVLDSKSEGPLTWVKIGIPNSHFSNVLVECDHLERFYTSDGSDTLINIYFDKDFTKGEVVSFDIYLTQDYMYQVDLREEGYTVYEFTPGWFDDIDVDSLTITWNADKVSEWSPKAEQKNNSLVWKSSLEGGEHFDISVTYPNDAFGFDLSKNIEKADDDPVIVTILAVIFLFIIVLGPIVLVGVIVGAISSYVSGSGFGKKYDTKITRTKIEYYPSCQGCGGPREEGRTNCSYCGRSFIKSEEVITEEDVPDEDKDILKHKKDGEYRYSSLPNTYVRVNVVKVPRPRPERSAYRSGSHSCAHSSCACACACACAGGGRAGCSTKDFYNTNLKLKQLKKRARK